MHGQCVGAYSMNIFQINKKQKFFLGKAANSSCSIRWLSGLTEFIKVGTSLRNALNFDLKPEQAEEEKVGA